MSTLIFFINIFSIDKLFFILFFTGILYIAYLFVSTNSLFFQLTLTLLFMLVSAVALSRNSLDFFAGFLLTAELPILLVGYFFFFHKNSLAFDSVYELHGRISVRVFFYSLFTLLFFLFFSSQNLKTAIYEFSLLDSVHIPHRNDFFIYYSFYYAVYPLFTVLVGCLIFFVSYLVILVYYSTRGLQKKLLKNQKHFSFIRKQNFLRQSTFSGRLSFFKKK